jgi:hypothetical protein
MTAPAAAVVLLRLQRDTGYAGRKRDYSAMMQDNRCAEMCKAAQGGLLLRHSICPCLLERRSNPCGSPGAARIDIHFCCLANAASKSLATVLCYVLVDDLLYYSGTITYSQPSYASCTHA